MEHSCWTNAPTLLVVDRCLEISLHTRLVHNDLFVRTQTRRIERVRVRLMKGENGNESEMLGTRSRKTHRDWCRREDVVGRMPSGEYFRLVLQPTRCIHN